jgi:hypothetical protein
MSIGRLTEPCGFGTRERQRAGRSSPFAPCKREPQGAGSARALCKVHVPLEKMKMQLRAAMCSCVGLCLALSVAAVASANTGTRTAPTNTTTKRSVTVAAWLLSGVGFGDRRREIDPEVADIRWDERLELGPVVDIAEARPQALLAAAVAELVLSLRGVERDVLDGVLLGEPVYRGRVYGFPSDCSSRLQPSARFLRSILLRISV